jgi:hypothetical protein
VHPGAARRAAELALRSPDLHEVKRSALREFLGAPESRGAGERPRAVSHRPAPEPPAPDEPGVAAADRSEPGVAAADRPGPGADHLSEEEVAAAARRLAARHAPLLEPSPAPAPPVERALFHGVPVELDDEALVFQRPDGPASRIGWREIEAVAVARIETTGGEPVTVVDFVLNWIRRDRETLRLVRLRDDGFDPARLLSSEGASLPDFLAEVLERSHAIPLPDPESALGLRPAVFDSLDAYELAVLGRPTG